MAIEAASALGLAGEDPEVLSAWRNALDCATIGSLAGDLCRRHAEGASRADLPGFSFLVADEGLVLALTLINTVCACEPSVFVTLLPAALFAGLAHADPGRSGYSRFVSAELAAAQLLLCLVPSALGLRYAFKAALRGGCVEALALALSGARLALHVCLATAQTGAADAPVPKDADRAEVPPHLWMVHGKLYDLAAFAKRHPGGAGALLLGRGRDCTALFQSYHPFTQRHREVLAKFEAPAELRKARPAATRVGAAPDSPSTGDAFYEELCEAVRADLDAQGVKVEDLYRAPLWRWGYYAAVLGALAWAYRGYALGSVGATAVLPLLAWLIGALGHDGGHYAVASSPAVNAACCHVGMFWLANPIMWFEQHTYAHHSHTNELDMDPDLHHFQHYLRVHRRLAWQPRHAAQRALSAVLPWYALVSFGACLFIPLKMAVFGDIHGVVPLPGMSVGKRLAAVVHCAAYVTLVLLVPLGLRGASAGVFAAAAWQVAASGMLFGLFSQVNHLVADAMAAGDRAAKGWEDRGWGVAQIETSNNFCTDSTFWHLLSNGLNQQIEHHLFPGVNHAHLPLLAPAVRRLCKDHGVLYKEYHTYGSLLIALGEHLGALSVDD